jgi:hypothetical protein
MIAAIWQFQWWMTVIGPNVVAAIVCAAPAAIFAWAKLIRPALRRFQEHERKVHELHEHFIAIPQREEL